MSVPASHRLATYGTLAPGRANAHQLDGLRGTWSTASVRGHLQNAGWGAGMGYPGLMLDPDGPEVEVFLFTSADLLAHWDRLDAFEGVEYRRELVTLVAGDAEMDAFIYALAAGEG